MSTHNFLEYSDNYLKTSRRLWQYYRTDPNDNITQSDIFKSNIKITGKASSNGNTKHVEIVVSLTQLSNFWRTLEMPLTNGETSFILTWSKSCVISSATGTRELAIPDTKLYVFVVTLSTEDNVQLLKELESGFKRTTNQNKYQQVTYKHEIDT